ncbi:hypothetical protein [Variovorax sp.]|jgi:hypothetical protein|uniref:hypothetical protein n=1 Tax=Variovorax sp. TaxID=1871043 RepID=UPI0037D9D600
MTTQLLAPDTIASISEATALTDGQVATVFLTSTTGTAVPEGAEVHLQVQRAGGAWIDIHVLRAPERLSADVRGPASFRVQRRGSTVQAAPVGAEFNLSTSSGGGGVGGGAVTIADGASATLGARADAPASSDTATASLMAFMKRLVGKIPGFGAAASAAALPVVLASDDAQIGTKTNAATALPAGGAGLIGWLSNIWNTLANGSLARETYSTVTPLSLPTLNPGSGFNQFGAQACTSLDLINNTGTTLEYKRGSTGTVFIPVPPGTSRLIQGITNANQIYVRRLDQSNTVVTLVAEAFAV